MKTKIKGGAERLNIMTDDNLMPDNKTEDIEQLKRYIISAEESLEAAKKALLNLTGEDLSQVNKNSYQTEKLDGLTVTPDGKIVEGIFDGENMIGPDGKVFPVPANYASKSKLIEGDRLKLTISENGTFIYKQIGPAPRKNVIGTLNFSDNVYRVLAEGKSYDVLYASVTYYKAKAGDRVTIVIPESGNSKWACLDNVIHDVDKTTELEENILDDEPKLSQNFDNIQPLTENQPAPETIVQPEIPQPEPAQTVENPVVGIPVIAPDKQEVPKQEENLEPQQASELEI